MKEFSHTFAICAYKESEYLEECILSLKNQTLKTNILMATSTPNEYIKNLAENTTSPCTFVKEKVISGMIGTLHIIQRIQNGLRLRIRTIDTMKIMRRN